MTVVAVARVVYPASPRCRWCHETIRSVLSDSGTTWVHLAGGFPCRDPLCGLALSTQATPEPAAES